MAVCPVKPDNDSFATLTAYIVAAKGRWLHKNTRFLPNNLGKGSKISESNSLLTFSIRTACMPILGALILMRSRLH